jgi:uncharacterized protein YbaA (DUF1428 family)
MRCIMSTVFPSRVEFAREEEDREARTRAAQLNREHFVRVAFEVFPDGLPDGTTCAAFVAASPAKKVEILRLLAEFSGSFEDSEATRGVYRVLQITLSAFEADVPKEDEWI